MDAQITSPFLHKSMLVSSWGGSGEWFRTVDSLGEDQARGISGMGKGRISVALVNSEILFPSLAHKCPLTLFRFMSAKELV